MKKQINVILAPPGSGKSTFITKKMGLELPAVEPEHLAVLQNVYALMQQRFGDRWWYKPEACTHKDELIASIFCDMIRSDVVFITSEYVFFDNATNRAVVVPPFEVHYNNMAERLNNRTPGAVYLGQELYEVRECYFAKARDAEVVAQSSFTTAFSKIMNAYLPQEQ